MENENSWNFAILGSLNFGKDPMSEFLFGSAF